MRSKDSPTRSHVRAESVIGPHGMVLGLNDLNGSGTAAPTAGDHLRGEIVWNLAATHTGYAGWICTSSGNPGAWRTFGVIS